MRKNILVDAKTAFWQKIALLVFSAVITLVILEAGLRLGGVILVSLRDYRNHLAVRLKGAYRVLCVGESTTFAGGLPVSYPSQLEEVLNQQNMGIKFSVINKGLPGQDTTDIVREISGFLDIYRPQMVIAMMGINDGIPYIPIGDSSQAHARFRNFFNSLRVVKLGRFLKAHILAKMEALHMWMFSFEANFQALPKRSNIQQLYEYYVSQGNLLFSEEMFRKAIMIMPQGVEAYAGLAKLYRYANRWPEAEGLYNKAIELEPDNYKWHAELGNILMFDGKIAQAEESYRKAIMLCPQDTDVYAQWGWWEYVHGRIGKAEEVFKEAMALAPASQQAYYFMGRLYLEEGKGKEAEVMYQEALKRNALDDMAYGGLIAAYIMSGDLNAQKEFDRKVKQHRERFYNPATYDNYHKLKKILDERGIKLVCVQYPMRHLYPLKQIFGREAGNLIFVDNEQVFKRAVIKEGYQEYFTDMFGGDFGHCTRKGYRLLAENIAKVILEEEFNDKYAAALAKE